jgi:hypothetical protein
VFIYIYIDFIAINICVESLHDYSTDEVMIHCNYFLHPYIFQLQFYSDARPYLFHFNEQGNLFIKGLAHNSLGLSSETHHEPIKSPSEIHGLSKQN